mgnify:CR=1 FL=1
MPDRIVKPDSGNDLVLQNDDASAKIEINEAGTIVHTGTSSIDVSGGTFTTSSAQKQAIVQAGPGSGTLDRYNPAKQCSGCYHKIRHSNFRNFQF